MAETSNGPRTHEPSLRELTAELDGIRELFQSKVDAMKELVNERHGRYEQRFNSQDVAVQAALEAAEKQTAAAFLASERAITKAEEAQKSYNVAHNDLSRRMDDQYKSMVPAPEARLKWDSIDKEYNEIRKEIGLLRDAQPKEVSGLRTELMKEIQSLREYRSEQGGGARVIEAAKTQRDWSIGIYVAIALGVISTALSVIGLLKH